MTIEKPDPLSPVGAEKGELVFDGWRQGPVGWVVLVKVLVTLPSFRCWMSSQPRAVPVSRRFGHTLARQAYSFKVDTSPVICRRNTAGDIRPSESWGGSSL